VVRLQRDHWTLDGVVDLISHDAQRLVLDYRYAEPAPKDFLRGWLAHLAAASSGQTVRTVIVGGVDGAPIVRAYPPVSREQAVDILAALLELHGQWRIRPMPFAAASSHAFAKAMQKPDATPAAALAKAKEEWLPSAFKRAEGVDPYLSRAFGPDGPMQANKDAFQAIARLVFDPLILASSEVDL
jgi:exonuclease V gamma subunit